MSKHSGIECAIMWARIMIQIEERQIAIDEGLTSLATAQKKQDISGMALTNIMMWPLNEKYIISDQTTISKQVAKKIRIRKEDSQVDPGLFY